MNFRRHIFKLQLLVNVYCALVICQDTLLGTRAQRLASTHSVFLKKLLLAGDGD
jgi:hypothetical protein